MPRNKQDASNVPVVNTPVINYGAFTYAGQQQLKALELQPLSGTADIVNAHHSANYIILSTSANAITFQDAPVPGDDDGIRIRFINATDFAHTVTMTGLLESGAAGENGVIFPAFAGGIVDIMAWQGDWILLNAVSGCCGLAVTGAGPAAPNLGFGAPYGIGARASISNTGATTVNGSAYLGPGSSITGAPTITGTTDVNNGAEAAAEASIQAAYLDLAGRTQNVQALAGDIGGTTLPPGLYKNASSVLIQTGTSKVTLDAGGNANAIWIFQIGTTLTVANGGGVILANGAQAKNVFFQVGTSATFAGGGQTFFGNILAAVSISLGTSGVSVARFFAGANGDATGAISFAGGNTVTVPS